MGRHRTTVLFASHTLAEVEQLADRVALLDQGKLIALASPAELCRMTDAATLDAALERLIGRDVFAEAAS